MKKTLSVAIVIIMIFTLVACGNEKKAEKYCWNCGDGISKKAAFCEHCGTLVGNTAFDSIITPSPIINTTSTPTYTTLPTDGTIIMVDPTAAPATEATTKITPMPTVKPTATAKLPTIPVTTSTVKLPTIQPATPVATSTAKPTVVPTVKPTPTAKPTPTPTAKPTPTLTAKPTEKPVESISIQFPKTPLYVNTIKFNSNTGKYGVSKTIRIDSFSYKIDSLGHLDLYCSGEKTYDIDGANSTYFCEMNWRLYDLDGYLIDSGWDSVSRLKVGDKFKNHKINVSLINITAGESYRFEVFDSSYE